MRGILKIEEYHTLRRTNYPPIPQDTTPPKTLRESPHFSNITNSVKGNTLVMGFCCNPTHHQKQNRGGTSPDK